ncbi:glycerophosphodiester phosphodiesterase [Undibacterium arcticum]|uniref:Glycerophosphodiester phosphodiesterase n=1 Tax=Undibacterium arcticum TaxID=1762892 RepID=A0ABV7EZY6_9BURK
MWPYPKIVAHRGAGILAPENTLAAMQAGLGRGFHAVEFDVMLSQDEIPVLMHDHQFGRTVSGVGAVSDCAARQLSAMDAGAWFSDAYRGEPVPLLAQVIDFCQENGIWMNVEIKPAPGFEEVTGRIVGQMLRQRFAAEFGPGAHARSSLPLLSSFSELALVAARRVAPEIPRALLVDVIPPDWQARLNALAAVSLNTNHRTLTPQLARAVKQGGFGLFCYTVNDPARAHEILGWGVDGFCTDRIDLIAADFA